MSPQNIVLLIIIGLLFIGAGYVIFGFIRSIKEKRAYENEELPDLYASDVEEEALPDVEESGFSRLEESLTGEDNEATDILEGSFSSEDEE